LGSDDEPDAYTPEIAELKAALERAEAVEGALWALFEATKEPRHVVSAGAIAHAVAARLGWPAKPLQTAPFLASIAAALGGAGLTSRRTRRGNQDKRRTTVPRCWIGIRPRGDERAVGKSDDALGDHNNARVAAVEG
jgi:hypothetical protein